MKPTETDATAQFEAALAAEPAHDYVLRLYITGMSIHSTEAIATIKALCETHLSGRYDLEIIDLYVHPHLAEQEQIVAAPTLVRRKPLPLRRLIGNLSDTARVLAALNLHAAA